MAMLFLLLLFSSSLISGFTYGAKHEKEYCAMYDICGARSDGKVLNCPFPTSSVKPDDYFSAKIQSLCPAISGNVCCTETQFDTLRAQVQQVNGNLTVDGIAYYVTDDFGERLYDSCKDVKFGTMNTRALDFVGGGANKFKDGTDPNVKSKAMSYDQLMYIQHLDSEPVHTERPGELIAYYKIARHYKWAMDQLFYKHNFSRVIILEDDMEIAPDFFDYFEAAAALLDKDKSIMAVSSWNDNGQKQFVHDPYELYRSDFFPGLGWMLTKSIWDELSPKWPKAYPFSIENHKGRQFIRPEVCRTYNFGEHGSSLGQFFQQYLQPIKLNDVKVDWKSRDLSYLMKDKYTKHFADIVRKAKPIQGTDAVLKASNIEGDVRIQYKDQPDFERIARQLGIFQEWKDGIPRTSFKGVVVFRYQTTRRVFLVGPDSLRQLGIKDARNI
ncbi:complex glycan less family protein [Populus alba x Populus x berolinensis]|uniref:Alpha-1,3-mannosyl-glycoprotein 2-beta-N-acetylglucosaminyltransferase n=1 Tax=Populus alba x Populus x berolinensis TaxID=444605 RepID=A0AAD6MIZ6_9ROSI|nr:complex glycan less family protein [Populus alba x Populus x berolinensis]